MDVKIWFEQEIVPCVRADGGWLELTEVRDGAAEVTARGECAHCAALDRCLHWAQARAKRELDLEMHFSVRREPFLWIKIWRM